MKEKKDKLPKKSFISRFDWLNKFKHWYMGRIGLTRSIFRVRAAWQTVGVIIVILSIFFVIAAFYTESGEFVINLDSEMADGGFYLSDTPDYSDHLVTLNGTAVINADNINIYDIVEDVNKIDGEHNGKNYVAYTFYLTNDSGATKDYQYSLNIRGSAKEAEKAMWLLFFKNDELVVYAMNGANGEPETQLSAYDFPFKDHSLLKDEQYATVPYEEVKDKFNEEDLPAFGDKTTIKKLITKPFESNSVVCSDVVKGIEYGAQDKYTVVIWYEGEDPECVDDILGGWVELYMNFSFAQ